MGIVRCGMLCCCMPKVLSAGSPVDLKSNEKRVFVNTFLVIHATYRHVLVVS